MATPETQALDVTCPLCGAQPGTACSYAHAVREDDTDRFVRWERVQRTAHQPRVAVATHGTMYGHSLRQLLNTCRCGAEAAMQGRHTAPTCPWNLPGRTV